MRRVLDELADALHRAHGNPLPRRIAASAELPCQFGLPITPSRWTALERCLGRPLPPLQRQGNGLWSFPCGWRTVWDVAAYLVERTGWQPPSGTTAADWLEAQIFIGVRDCLVEALNVDLEEVVRPARLIADLGA